MNRANTLPELQVASESELPVSQACLRNQQPIADALKRILPKYSVVLEIGSGTGQHAAYITSQMPDITWQPSELATGIASVNAWRHRSGRTNFLPPLVLDVSQDLWPVKQVDAVFAANIVHYISWPKVRAMMSGIGRVLRVGGQVCFYGPFNYQREFTSDGNRKLDAWLKADVDPEAGIKDFEQLVLAARREKLKLVEDIEMPANNRLLRFRRYSG